MLKVFDYRCEKCGYEDEKLMSSQNMDKRRCPQCRERMVRLPPATRTSYRYADMKLKF